jgi:hypothetical protein
MNINWDTLERLWNGERMRNLRILHPRAALLVLQIAMAGLRNRVPEGGIIRDITVRVPIGDLVPAGKTRTNAVSALNRARATGIISWETRYNGNGCIYTVHVG